MDEEEEEEEKDDRESRIKLIISLKKHVKLNSVKEHINFVDINDNNKKIKKIIISLCALQLIVFVSITIFVPLLIASNKNVIFLITFAT